MPQRLTADHSPQAQEQFARLVTDQGRLPRVDVSAVDGQGSIYLQGAHICRFKPHGREDVLFVSEYSRYEAGSPIRGGVPVCFPWFGPKGDEPEAPSHGLARTVPWRLQGVRTLAGGEVRVELSLGHDRYWNPLWRHAFDMRLVAVFGESLAISLQTTNLNDVASGPFTFEAALHTYLAVGDIERVSIGGLEDVDYLDKVDGMKVKRQSNEPITFKGETDRVYQNTVAPCTVEDEALGRTITVDKAGSHSTVVWNPWIEKSKRLEDLGDDEWRRFVCVETANIGDAAVTLEPGARHTMRATIRVS